MSDDHHSSVPIGIPTYDSRAAVYKEILASVESLITPTEKEKQELLQQQQATSTSSDWRLFSRLNTNLANISSVLFYALNADFTKGKDAPLHSLPINWCGWYLLDRPDRLALSCFQGKLACTHIKLGKGMCGKAALTNKDLAIADVQAEPGHIACDAASQSEVVIVLKDPLGRVVGVLDIDSAVKGTFSAEVDVPALRKICDAVTKAHPAELLALFSGAIGKAGAAAASIPVSAIPGATRISPGGISAVRIEAAPGGGGDLVAAPIGAVAASAAAANSGSGCTAVLSRPPNNVAAMTNRRREAPSETGDMKRIGNWELRWRSVGEMLNSAGLSKLEDRLQVKLLPEIIFDLNEIHFVMDDGAGVNALKFRVCAQSSLADVVEFSASEEYKTSVKDTLLPKDSDKWASKRSEFATFDPKVDWAFRNRYGGVWSDGKGAPISPVPVAPRTAGSDVDKTNYIDYDLLRRIDLPIIFFSSIDLWEDDLHDHGVSQMSAKARVMEPCFFVLVRHVLRVDGVKMEVRDCRHFHIFGSKKICIEQSLKSLDIGAYLEKRKGDGLTEEDLHRLLMNCQVEQLPMLVEEWKNNFVILL